MGFRGGGGWFRYMHADDEQKANITWPLLKRVLGYAQPYRTGIVFTLLLILLSTGLGLLTPLIFRDLIDNTLATGDVGRLNLLAAGLVMIPVVSGLLRVIQRKINANIGEGVIYDLAREFVYPSATYVTAVFHQHQNWRVDESPQ